MILFLGEVSDIKNVRYFNVVHFVYFSVNDHKTLKSVH